MFIFGFVPAPTRCHVLVVGTAAAQGWVRLHLRAGCQCLAPFVPTGPCRVGPASRVLWGQMRGVQVFLRAGSLSFIISLVNLEKNFSGQGCGF